MRILYIGYFFLITLALPLYATVNNPNFSILLRNAEIYDGLYISGRQTIAEENSCSYNEYIISGAFYADTALVCEVWDDGKIKDSKTIYSKGSIEQLYIVLSFEGLYSSSNSGVGIYCHEQGVSSYVFEYDPFYPEEISGYCPSTVSPQQACIESGGIWDETIASCLSTYPQTSYTSSYPQTAYSSSYLSDSQIEECYFWETCDISSSSSSISPERSCILSGGIYMQNIFDKYECIYPNSSEESCEISGGQWILSLGAYTCRDISSSSSSILSSNSSSSSSIDPIVLETVKVQQSLYIDSLKEFEYGSDEQKERLKIIEEMLKKDEKVLTVERTESGNALWVSYRDGFDGLISTTPSDSKGAVSIELKKISDKKLRASKIGNNKVLSIMAQYYSWGENDDIPLITSLLDDHGYDVTKKIYENHNSGSIEDFMNWDTYGIILVSSHGEATRTKTAIHINTELNSSEFIKYQDDLIAKHIILWGDSYGITESFIEKYNGVFSNALVYMSICKGAYNDGLANVIIDKGAASYLSYDNYVDVSFAKTYGVRLFEDLLKSNGSLSTAYISGTKETDGDPAELKLFGNSQLSIQLENTSIIDEVLIEDIVVKEVGGKSTSFDGHFIHYSSDIFDWIYILASGHGVYKLNGLEADGHIQWSENLLDSFDNVKFSIDGESVIFGSAINEQEIVQILENNTYIINGHFVHYASGAFDWIYITSSGTGVYKLNGLKEDGKFDWSDNLIDNFSDVIIDSNNKSVKFDLDNESVN